MQVTHQNEHVTHAVIGGGQTIDFGISSSAEFFNILSSTLYSDQILAVVREVLCNAWDAHIEAGRTDIPVEVTLTNDKFVIKDVGKGIHHDDMGLIYGTYGNSTKKNDGKQTGGFGLGCKAPFAYTDHFEVTSSHDGIKTIYTLSKSSAQAQGKPGITPIASFPTTETGLQVSIRVKNGQDHGRFLSLVARIARQGDMNISLNGKAVETLDFDVSKYNFTIRPRANLDNGQHQILVRYGNVIYPVVACADISRVMSRLITFLNNLGGNNYYAILFQAPPHSISVTPSRESLSMQEHTIKTLISLFQGFLDLVDTQFVEARNQYAKMAVEKAVTDKRIGELLNRRRELPPLGKLGHLPVIADLDSMAEQYMGRNYPPQAKFFKEDIKHRLSLMVAANTLQRGDVQCYLRELEKSKEDYTDRWCVQEKNTWLHRKVIAPLMAKLMKAGLDHSRLYVCDHKDLGVDPYGRGQRNNYLVPATQANPAHHIAALPYLRNIVVLATAKTDLINRVFRHEVFKKLGTEYGFLFYHVGMKAAEKAAALDFFKASGMNVVDLTFRQEWEEEKEVRVVTPRKKAKKGVVALSALKGNGHINTNKFRDDDAARTENPEFIVQVSFRSSQSAWELEEFTSSTSSLIVEMFGDKGGVVNSTASMDSWIDKGAKKMRPYLEEKVSHYLLNSPTIKEYWAFHLERVLTVVSSHPTRSLIRTIYSNEILRKKFSLANNLTEEDQKYLALWKALIPGHRHYSRSDLVRQTMEALEAIPLDKHNDVLVEKLCGNPLLCLLNVDEVSSVLNPNHNNSQELIDKTLAVLDAVLS